MHSVTLTSQLLSHFHSFLRYFFRRSQSTFTSLFSQFQTSLRTAHKTIKLEQSLEKINFLYFCFCFRLSGQKGKTREPYRDYFTTLSRSVNNACACVVEFYFLYCFVSVWTICVCVRVCLWECKCLYVRVLVNVWCVPIKKKTTRLMDFRWRWRGWNLCLMWFGS